jgi:hypothetical protein
MLPCTSLQSPERTLPLLCALTKPFNAGDELLDRKRHGLSVSTMFDGVICTLGDGAEGSFWVTRPPWTIHLTTG